MPQEQLIILTDALNLDLLGLSLVVFLNVSARSSRLTVLASCSDSVITSSTLSLSVLLFESTELNLKIDQLANENER